MAFNRKLTVIKIGGSLLERGHFKKLIRALSPVIRGRHSVLVHGGGKEITALGQKFGVQSRFVNGRRFTDRKLMEVVEMALSGKVNRHLVGLLNASGVPAFGLSGRDHDLVRARRIQSLGQVGIPVRVRLEWVRLMLSRRTVPVFASIASDGKGNALNVNADEMASALAAAFQADRLILFTDVPGIRGPGGKTMTQITPETGRRLIRKGLITGGMIPKVKSSFEALKRGVKEIWILQGRLPLRQSEGTVISKGTFHAKHPFR